MAAASTAPHCIQTIYQAIVRFVVFVGRLLLRCYLTDFIPISAFPRGEHVLDQCEQRVSVLFGPYKASSGCTLWKFIAARIQIYPRLNLFSFGFSRCLHFPV